MMVQNDHIFDFQINYIHQFDEYYTKQQIKSFDFNQKNMITN